MRTRLLPVACAAALACGGADGAFDAGPYRCERLPGSHGEYAVIERGTQYAIRLSGTPTLRLKEISSVDGQIVIFVAHSVDEVRSYMHDDVLYVAENDPFAQDRQHEFTQGTLACEQADPETPPKTATLTSF